MEFRYPTPGGLVGARMDGHRIARREGLVEAVVEVLFGVLAGPAGALGRARPRDPALAAGAARRLERLALGAVERLGGFAGLACNRRRFHETPLGFLEPAAG